MNLRTRVLVGALRRLPKPDPPTAAYLTGVRRELPWPLAPLSGHCYLWGVFHPPVTQITPAG